MGNNVAHLESTLETFEDYLKTKNPSVFMLQETKTKKAGQIKTESTNKYIFYELHRKKENVSGKNIAICVLKDLHPVFVDEGDDEVEALTVEIWVEDFPTRLVVAYGPQNTDRENNPQKHKDKKKIIGDKSRMNPLEPKKNAAGFLVHMDGNLHAGEQIVPKDPNSQNKMANFSKLFLKEALGLLSSTVSIFAKDSSQGSAGLSMVMRRLFLISFSAVTNCGHIF